MDHAHKILRFRGALGVFLGWGGGGGQKPRDMIWGRIFREMIRVSAQKSELQAKRRSYRPKVRVTGGETSGIRTEPPRKGT